MTSTSTPRVSERFYAADADVTFMSHDNVIFKVYRKNIEVQSGGFSAPPEMVSAAESVPLPEKAEVLEILFQFMSPQRLPELKELNFEVLTDLAEAAEKYEVYSALNMCRDMMRTYTLTQPFAVLEFAAKHGYPDIAKEAGSKGLESDALQVFQLSHQYGNKDLAQVAGLKAIEFNAFRVLELSHVYGYEDARQHVDAIQEAFDLSHKNQYMELIQQAGLKAIESNAFQVLVFAHEYGYSELIQPASNKAVQENSYQVLKYTCEHKLAGLYNNIQTMAVLEKPLEILQLAVDAGLQDVMDIAAKQALAVNLGDAVKANLLSQKVLVAWVKYYAAYMKITYAPASAPKKRKSPPTITWVMRNAWAGDSKGRVLFNNGPDQPNFIRV